MSRRIRFGLTWIEGAVGLMGFLLSGFYLPWWGLCLPAVLCGMYLAPRPYSWIAVAFLGGLTWTIAAAIGDFSSGGRISLRIAGVGGLGNALVVYLLTAAVASVMVALAAKVGASARGVRFLPGLIFQKTLAANKQGD